MKFQSSALNSFSGQLDKNNTFIFYKPDISSDSFDLILQTAQYLSMMPELFSNFYILLFYYVIIRSRQFQTIIRKQFGLATAYAFTGALLCRSKFCVNLCILRAADLRTKFIRCMFGLLETRLFSTIYNSSATHQCEEFIVRYSLQNQGH